MGNCVSSSCTEIVPAIIRVLLAVEGRAVDVEVPASESSMKVGELMLEFPPGHFLAQLNKSDFLGTSAGKRAAPLAADADAKPGSTVYVLFPMSRLHTRISSQELLSFAKLLHLHDEWLITCKAAYSPSKVRLHGLFTAGARVAPLVAEQESKEHANLDNSDADANHEKARPVLQESEQDSVRYPDYSCQGHIQYGVSIIKSKPWAPKLETIMECS